MDNGKSGNGGSFLSGLMLGSLVGTALSLLLAPKSGRETRAQIVNKGLELRDQAMETAEEARQRVEGAAAHARSRVEVLTTGARERAEELGQRSQAILGGQKEVLVAAVEGARRAGQRKHSQLERRHIPTVFPVKE